MKEATWLCGRHNFSINPPAWQAALQDFWYQSLCLKAAPFSLDLYNNCVNYFHNESWVIWIYLDKEPIVVVIMSPPGIISTTDILTLAVLTRISGFKTSNHAWIQPAQCSILMWVLTSPSRLYHPHRHVRKSANDHLTHSWTWEVLTSGDL